MINKLPTKLTLALAAGAISLSSSTFAQLQITPSCPIHGQGNGSVFIPPNASYTSSRPSREVLSMVNSLRGNSTSAHRSTDHYARRSIKLNSAALPKGSLTYQGHASAGAHSYPASPYSSTAGYSGGAHNHASGELSYQVDHGCQLCTNEIKFIKNSTMLADECSLTYLRNLALALQDPSLIQQRFVIEGHASAEGTYSTNQILSQRRANAIFDFLVRQGVNPSRLLSVGHGEGQARYASHSPEYLRAKDRRVMVFKLAY